MKKVVFSFDDGLLDFYENIFPILKRYKIKATLNVATGLVDRTFNDGFEYCSIDQIKEMSEYGIEIGIHSDSHKKETTVEDLEKSRVKLVNWIGEDKIHGVVIPYNMRPTNSILDWIDKIGLKYLRGDEISKVRLYHRLFFKLKLLKKSTLFARQSSKFYKIKSVTYIPCVAVYNSRDLQYFIKLFRKIPNNHSLTLMFHSVLHTEEEIKKCPYPRGAWLVDNFDKLVKWLLDNNYQICSQQEVL